MSIADFSALPTPDVSALSLAAPSSTTTTTSSSPTENISPLHVADLIVSSIRDPTSPHFFKSDKVERIKHRFSVKPIYKDIVIPAIVAFVKEHTQLLKDSLVQFPNPEEVVCAVWLHAGKSGFLKENDVYLWLQLLSKEKCDTTNISKQANWIYQLGWIEKPVASIPLKPLDPQPPQVKQETKSDPPRGALPPPVLKSGPLKSVKPKDTFESLEELMSTPVPYIDWRL